MERLAKQLNWVLSIALCVPTQFWSSYIYLLSYKNNVTLVSLQNFLENEQKESFTILQSTNLQFVSRGLSLQILIVLLTLGKLLTIQMSLITWTHCGHLKTSGAFVQLRTLFDKQLSLILFLNGSSWIRISSSKLLLAGAWQVLFPNFRIVECFC